jgi:light-regulated signal transduction histidine kinase (bacteriophytochrome)
MREESYSSQYLDLCLGRDFARLMGGGISIDSKPGKGSLVEATIPVNGHASETLQSEKIS